METSYKYSDGNRVISLENKRQGTVISAWEYGYDVDGNILSKINKAGSAPATISYQYDRLGRLTEEDYSGWKRTLYTYDAYSNRMKMMVEGRTKDELVSVTSYVYGLDNRLEKEVKKQGKITETYRYCYDDNGNETFRIWVKTAPTPDYPGNVKLSGNYQSETPTVYEWRHYDGFNQLSRINQDDKEIAYQYRGDGMRHSVEVRKLTESQSKTNLYCWDGSDIVAEQVAGSKIKTYLRGINLITTEKDSMVYYYIFNEHGDVTQLWSQSGTCKASYEYDAFGVERNLDKEDENPFRYCGEYFDLSSRMYYLRARDYRPVTGRFLTEDPIRDGLNWYAYANNNPIMFDDPSGYAAKSSWVKTAAKIALGIVVVGAAIVISAATLGVAPAVALSTVAAGAVIGTVSGAAVDVGMQYVTNDMSFKNYNIDSTIIAGVQGGVSGAFGMTTFGVGSQMFANAAIAGIGSAVKGDGFQDILFNTAIGGVAGWVGGAGVGVSGFRASESLAWKRAVAAYGKGALKSTFVSNGLSIAKNYGTVMWNNVNNKVLYNSNDTVNAVLAAANVATDYTIKLAKQQLNKVNEILRELDSQYYRVVF